jgi:hypothetical protein
VFAEVNVGRHSSFPPTYGVAQKQREQIGLGRFCEIGHTTSMQDAATIKKIRGKYAAMRGMMDERVRRQRAASEALALGWSGASAVATATGMWRNTIDVGVRELRARAAKPKSPVVVRIRRAGGGPYHDPRAAS